MSNNMKKQKRSDWIEFEIVDPEVCRRLAAGESVVVQLVNFDWKLKGKKWRTTGDEFEALPKSKQSKKRGKRSV